MYFSENLLISFLCSNLNPPLNTFPSSENATNANPDAEGLKLFPCSTISKPRSGPVSPDQYLSIRKKFTFIHQNSSVHIGFNQIRADICLKNKADIHG